MERKASLSAPPQARSSPSLSLSLSLLSTHTLPACLTMYLLAAMRAASSASLQICSFSQDTMWMQ